LGEGAEFKEDPLDPLGKEKVTDLFFWVPGVKVSPSPLKKAL